MDVERLQPSRHLRANRTQTDHQGPLAGQQRPEALIPSMSTLLFRVFIETFVHGKDPCQHPLGDRYGADPRRVGEDDRTALNAGGHELSDA